MHYATQFRNITAVKALIDVGADVNVGNIDHTVRGEEER
jgi:hypothetical protein